MASWPLVRNRRPGGRPMATDLTGSSIWARGTHCRAPISACPACSRTYARCTVLIPFATLPAQPRYCRCTPAVAWPCFCWPVSSSVPTTSPRRRPDRQNASSSPATANRRTSPIAADVSQTARFSSRCILSGVGSPACSAIVQPLRRGSPLTSALTYFPACSHGPVRAKCGLSSHNSSTRFPAPARAPILAAAAASVFVVRTNCMIARRLPHAATGITGTIAPITRSKPEWPLPY